MSVPLISCSVFIYNVKNKANQNFSTFFNKNKFENMKSNLTFENISNKFVCLSKMSDLISIFIEKRRKVDTTKNNSSKKNIRGSIIENVWIINCRIFYQLFSHVFSLDAFLRLFLNAKMLKQHFCLLIFCNSFPNTIA